MTMEERSDAAAAAVDGEDEGVVDAVIMKELVDDMKSKLNNDSSSLLVKLTPDQEQLGIPPFLVYLAGLAIFLDQSNSSDAKENRVQQPTSFSVVQKQTFLKLQTLYHQGIEERTKPFLFQLSPRLIPNNEMQEIIIDLVTQKQIERAEAVMKGLLLLETEDERNKIDVSARTRRKKQSRRRRERKTDVISSGSIDSEDEKDRPDEKNTTVTGTLEDLLVSTKLSTANLLPQDDDSSWIQVGRIHKTKSCDKPPLPKKVPLQDLASSPYHHENHNDDEGSVKQITTTDTETGKGAKEEIVSPLLIQEACMTASGGKDKGIHCVFQEALTTQKGDLFSAFQEACTTTIEETKAAVQVKNSVTKMTNHPEGCQSYHVPPTITRTSKNDSNIMTRANKNDDDDDEEMVVNIEILLQQQRQQLENEHARSLQKQREDYEERIQALQLRLYISDTRLKTYEEALSQHVEAVAANICH